MSRAELIYPIRRILESQLSKIEGDPYNREVLTRYYKVRMSQVASPTVLAEFIRLVPMSAMLGKKFEDATIPDIEDLIFRIDQMKNKDSTKNKYRKVLRAFYRWLRGYPKRNGFPPEVNWIELKKVPLVTVTPDQLPPFEDCVKISEQADNPRDRALIQCLLDAGVRIGEMLTPKIGEVQFNAYGAVIHSDGKTGPGPCILTWSASALATWLNFHPFREDKDAPLWPVFDCAQPRQLTYDGARSMFQKCAKKAGIKGRIWLHLLKHVSSTHDSDIGMPDSYRRYKHHWTPNSPMPKVYEHLSKKVVTKIQTDSLQRLGIQPILSPEDSSGDHENEIALIRTCARCSNGNSPDSKFCNKCGYPLNKVENKEEALYMVSRSLDSKEVMFHFPAAR